MPKRETQHGQVPSLSPRFGGADKKPRFLDKEAMSIGRARGCDIALDANEVSAVHCLVYRSAAGGFRIRDCGSRTGTRLNGAAVKSAPVADGDMLQIGPFTFEVKVPPEALTQAAEPAIDLRRWERVANSRRRLARLALGLRRRLREGQNRDHGLTEEPVELTVVNGRSQQLQQSEAELAQVRAQIEQEREAHRESVQLLEADLARKLQETEEATREQWAEFQQRCAAEEARLQELSAAAAGQNAAAGSREAVQSDLAEREEQLKQREAAWEGKEADIQRDCEEVDRERQEVIRLKSQAEAEQKQRQIELDRQRAAVEQAEAKLREQKTELAQMLSDVKRIQEELKKQPRSDVKPLQHENLQLRQKIAELEKGLAEAAQAAEAAKAELAQMERAQADRAQAEGDSQAGGEAEGELKTLRAENDELRKLLQEQLFKPSGGEALRKENEELRQILTELEERLAAEIAAGASSGSSAGEAQMREENELLRQLLQEKDKILDEIRAMPQGASDELPAAAREHMEAQAQELERLQAEVARLQQEANEAEEKRQPQPVEASAPVPSSDNIDLDSYEAELNRYRQQLESDRLKLNQEIETLRSRNAELDEATREMEMEMSRERAEMARERIRLDRLREEIKSEMERIQRDGGVRDSLSSFQRLRDEVRATGARR